MYFYPLVPHPLDQVIFEGKANMEGVFEWFRSSVVRRLPTPQKWSRRLATIWQQVGNLCRKWCKSAQNNY
uniref:Uncharacterized protein n=1 Tax=Physcomitrium patens TaxID=3218 RepID=A0A2K1K1L2_PHYPA|nr:hypothetical protein PHYPA_012142 [Physcomitrium patens]